ncbi:hypothetical protein PCANC_16170 [Puccinia coronata f. sp. avenae]|uniref:Uncharacterized protein n=1 Tax=Puccinia coronata f. sp. avenae TaxID=200324 RepID=A0A2N5SZ64_9BASI|nr:hypothetical protein PCANC_16170 [Puccinia coronata f. sp. avenae]
MHRRHAPQELPQMTVKHHFEQKHLQIPATALGISNLTIPYLWLRDACQEPHLASHDKQTHNQMELLRFIQSCLCLNIRRTFYGNLWDLVSRGKDAKNVANTNLALDYHMDLVSVATAEPSRSVPEASECTLINQLMQRPHELLDALVAVNYSPPFQAPLTLPHHPSNPQHDPSNHPDTLHKLNKSLNAFFISFRPPPL